MGIIVTQGSSQCLICSQFLRNKLYISSSYNFFPRKMPYLPVDNIEKLSDQRTLVKKQGIKLSNEFPS